MQLKELVAQLETLAVAGPLEREIAGITYDSRRVMPGMVFVAVPGRHTDGHEHINAAIDRGASAVICERNGLVSQRTAKIKVSDSREAMARAAAIFYQHPAAKLTVVGVTGTNGKTTVGFMVKHILETAGVRTGLIGTVRYEIGERMVPAQRTTPEAVDIQQMLAQMLRADCRACVMEVSSHALEQKRVCGVDFDVAVFTNLTRDHLDYHGTMENYFAAKQKLFTALGQSAKPGAAVINLDDDYGRRLYAETSAGIRWGYGLQAQAGLRAVDLHLARQETRFQVIAPGLTFPCLLPLIGRHNVYNALAAIGAALALKIDPPAIQKALRTMPQVPGRLEAVSAGQPFGVFVDYAHTDDALRNVLRTLRELNPRRLLLVFGCGGNRDQGKRPRMGRVAAELADATWITSDNPRLEPPAKIAAQIEEGFHQVRTDGYQVELDRRRAIEGVLRLAEPGDLVLLAGKGHETYQEFEDTVVPFDDRQVARETIEALGFNPASS
jgi:UDP-N-acetylmuramoyl-L-alanyl-D-glutamate--2,6-diaminopimelate ligase